MNKVQQIGTTRNQDIEKEICNRSPFINSSTTKILEELHIRFIYCIIPTGQREPTMANTGKRQKRTIQISEQDSCTQPNPTQDFRTVRISSLSQGRKGQSRKIIVIRAGQWEPAKPTQDITILPGYPEGRNEVHSNDFSSAKAKKDHRVFRGGQ